MLDRLIQEEGDKENTIDRMQKEGQEERLRVEEREEEAKQVMSVLEQEKGAL